MKNKQLFFSRPYIYIYIYIYIPLPNLVYWLVGVNESNVVVIYVQHKWVD